MVREVLEKELVFCLSLDFLAEPGGRASEADEGLAVCFGVPA